MLILTSPTDPRISNLPPPHQPAILTTLHNLGAIYPPEPDPETQGFVAYVEARDDPLSIHRAIDRDLASNLEGVFRDGPCLVGVVLWGNAGAGVTIVCPDEEGHAPAIVSILESHL